MKRKVLVVAHGHPDFSKGGAEIAAYTLFQELNRRDDCEAWFWPPMESPACSTPARRSRHDRASARCYLPAAPITFCSRPTICCI